jgi:hypothetical protein
MNFRNLLAILAFIGMIPALWILNGAGIINVGETIVGASIAVWTLIGQFYFRKKES